MTRVVPSIATVALAAVLWSGVGASAAAPVPSAIHLSYERIFDLDHSRDGFIPGSMAVRQSADLVGATIFGIDISVPPVLKSSIAPPRVARALTGALAFTDESLAFDRPQSSWLQLDNARLRLQFTQPALDSVHLAMVPYASQYTAQFTPSARRTTSASDLGLDFNESPNLTPSSVGSASAMALATAQPSAFTRVGLPSAQAFSSSVSSATVRLTLPRIGAVDMTGRVGEAPDARRDAFVPSLGYSSERPVNDGLTAATRFSLRAGNRRLNVDVSSSFEHLATSQLGTLPYAPWNPDSNLSAVSLAPLADGPSPLIYAPNLVDVTKQGLGASVALPLTRSVTLGLGYDAQHYFGSYGSSLSPNIDSRNDSYLGKLTYQLPHSSSAITLSAHQFLYQDSFVPALNVKQTTENVNFTVKF